LFSFFITKWTLLLTSLNFTSLTQISLLLLTFHPILEFFIVLQYRTIVGNCSLTIGCSVCLLIADKSSFKKTEINCFQFFTFINHNFADSFQSWSISITFLKFRCSSAWIHNFLTNLIHWSALTDCF
jgi:hypothetical protein